MDRKLSVGLMVSVVRNAKHSPTIIRTVKNWPMYFLYYLGIRKGGAAYFFRSGATLRDREGTASGTIAVVFIRKHYGSVRGKSVIVEIGANIGTFAIYAATEEPSLVVYSYEPIPANYKVLVGNIIENELQDRIKTFNLGVAGERGQREFYLASSPEHSLVETGHSSQSVRIECVSLADILASNNLSEVDLLKINAEGAEYEILYSTPVECFDKIEEIRMEYHGRAEATYNLAHLTAFLERRGYAITHLYEHTSDEGFVWFKKQK